MGRWSLLKIFAIQAALFPAARAASQCYYPSSDPASGDTPCYADGRTTHCCGSDSACLTNGLCLSLSQPYIVSRGSCTDATWGSACPDYCTKAQPKSGAAVIWYNNGTAPAPGEPLQFCCNSILVDDGQLVCSNVLGQPQSPFQVQDGGSIIPNAAGLKGLVRQLSNNNTANNNTSTKSNSAADESKKNVAIGAGVGVPLGVIAILSIVWALYERRLRKRTPWPALVPLGAYGQPGKAESPSEPSELIGRTPMPAELYDSNVTRDR